MRIHIICLLVVLALGGNATAETGMGLVIVEPGLWNPGQVRRINLKNDQITYTTPPFGANAKHARFSPDGTKIAYTTSSKQLVVTDLNGNVLHSFAVWDFGSERLDGHVSWTDYGIWVGGIGKAVLYSESGANLGPWSASYTSRSGTAIHILSISRPATTVGAIDLCCYALSISSDVNQVAQLGEGCSVGPSADGSWVTHNLPGHISMKLHTRNNSNSYTLGINILPGYSAGVHSWNNQNFAGNSNKIIVIPAGQGAQQMYGSEMPWIYNLETNHAVCLYPNPNEAGVYWFITDFFDGVVVDPPVACGDGIVVSGEACDNGAANANTADACRTNCTLPRCGDGIKDTNEECDSGAGNSTAPDACRPTCKLASCGDGVVDSMETCGTCEEDCGVCQEGCGDGVCAAGSENCTLCPDDCGACPAGASITITSPKQGDVWHVGDTQTFKWTTVDLSHVVIRYSPDGGVSWRSVSDQITDSDPDWGNLDWVVPDEPSTNVMVHIEGYFLEAPTTVGPISIVAAGGPDSESNAMAQEPWVGFSGCAGLSPDRSGWGLSFLFSVVSIGVTLRRRTLVRRARPTR